MNFAWEQPALQIMYQQADQPNAVWERELQRFYPAAFGFADPWSLRLLADFISYGQAEPRGDSQRGQIYCSEGDLGCYRT